MSWNISYFVESIPLDYDSWNWTSRLDFIRDNLYSFTDLDDTSQNAIAQNFTSQNLADIWWNLYTVSTGLNATVEYLQHIVDTWIYPTEPPTTTPIPTFPPSPCDTIERYEMDFSATMGIPAVIIIGLITLYQKRKQYRLDRCFGRPGLVYPVNLVDETRRRWAFMAAFAIIAYKVLYIFEGKYFWKPDQFSDPEFTKTWGWLTVFVTLINVILLGIIYYPLLLCLTKRKYIIMNLLGIAYFTPWVVLIVAVFRRCSPTDRNEDERFMATLQLIFDAPIFVAYLVLLAAYILDLVRNLRKLYRRKTATNEAKYIKEERKLEFFNNKSIQYLQFLFNKKPVEPPTTMLEKIKRRISYEKVEGFCYSPRILCTMTLAALFLFKLHVYLDSIARFLYELAKELLPDIRPSLVDAFGETLPELVDYFEEAVTVIYWSFFTCFTVSLILHFFFMIHMLITYKRHMSKLLKGNIKWHFKNLSSPAQQMVYGMRYSGYQIAYMFYGYIIIGIIMFLGVILLTYLVIIPLRDGLWSPVIEQIKKLWPAVIVSMAILWGQIFLAKFCFLQERGLHMALNNRRLYHIVSFYLFFFNVVLGLFSCLLRIVMSMMFGMLLLSRLDRCLLMRGFERFDAGYKAYLGMLEVEIYHTHPLLRAFLMILHEQVLDTRRKTLESNTENGKMNIEKAYVNGAMTELKSTPSKTYDKRIVIKWWKMVTLVNNPKLIIDRIEKQIEENEKQKRNKNVIIDGIIESAAVVTAGFVGLTGAAMADGLAEITSL